MRPPIYTLMLVALALIPPLKATVQGVDFPIIIDVKPGLHPLGITRFPAGPDGQVSGRIGLVDLFGRTNEAGLQSGGPDTADLVWISQRDGSFIYAYYADSTGLADPLNPVRPGPTGGAAGEVQGGWRIVGNDFEDQSQLTWPITAGVLLERRAKEPLRLVLHGIPKVTDTTIPLGEAPILLNNVYGEGLTLADLGWEAFFEGPAPVDPTGIEPEAVLSYLDRRESFAVGPSGKWLNKLQNAAVEASAVPLGPTFRAGLIGRTVQWTWSAPLPAVRPRPFLGLEEGAVRRIAGNWLWYKECLCAFLIHGDRATSLHLMDARGDGMTVRVGKHPPGVISDALGVVRGQGVWGPLAFQSPAWRLQRWVRSFVSKEPLRDVVPKQVALKDPKLREREYRYFSRRTGSGDLALELSGPVWEANTLLEIDFLAAVSGSKVAIHVPSVMLTEACAPAECAKRLVELIQAVMRERGLLTGEELTFAIQETPSGGAAIVLRFSGRLLLGKLDVCAQLPPPAPVVTSASPTVSANGIVRVIGSDFGERLDDLCIVLAPPEEDPQARTIPLRPLALSADGSELFARVVGPLNDGRARRLKIARGLGHTQHVNLGFDDVIQREGIWTWMGTNTPMAVSPDVLRPALGVGDELIFEGVPSNGVLTVDLGEAWPPNARVRVAFTAQTATVQLDSYAPNLCFTVNGTVEQCAERVRDAIQRAFVQGGIADGHQIQAQVNVSAPNQVSLSVGLLTSEGAPAPITSGHLVVAVEEDENACEPKNPMDEDGDFVQDSWEVNEFGQLPPQVDALGDPDMDAWPNALEFAFNLRPHAHDTPVLQVSLSEARRVVLTYQRHEAASFFYHYDIESSFDGGREWETLNNLDITEVVKVDSQDVTVIAESLLNASQLPGAQFRLRVSPRE